MNRTAVFSKTGKGLLEIKNKANRLSKDQYRVLNLIDGKSALADLADKAKVPEVELRKILSALSEGGFVKEFNNPGDVGSSTVPPSTSYADDLDFTTILGPSQSAKPGFYQSAQTEQRQREESARKASEAAATKAREESERKAREEAARKASVEEAGRRVREEAEQRARLEAERREQLAAEMRNKVEAEKFARQEAERRARETKEAIERKLQQERFDAERRDKEDVERRAKIQAEARARVEAEKRAHEEEERKRREDEERARKEEEEARKRREEEEHKRKEEDERKRREEEERRRKEEEERKRREEEERRRKEEEERKRREEEERRRKEEEERKRREEEERKRREEEERRRREEEERKRREEEERKRKEEEERKRHEEEERRLREEEERKRKEEAERKRKEEAERLRRELEDKHKREADELLKRLEENHRREQAGLPTLDEEEEAQRREEQRQRREQEERARREEEDRARRADEERKRREEDERRRREEADRARRDEEDRKRREEERKAREQESRAALAFPTLDRKEAPSSGVSRSFDSELEALKRAEAEVEKEFVVKEEAIRIALEEQERRFRMEEEARTAMDRAEREAREKSDRESRELALAAERARKEAEQSAREESARRAQEEKERRAKEQEDRKKQSEGERKKRERERREAEQRAREEELSRRRKEQEERDRRKSEIERIGQGQRKQAFGPAKIAVVVVVALVGLAFALIEFAPMSAYAPNIEKAASDAVGEPVRIGNVHASLFPGFHLRLDNVTVGNTQDVKIPTVIVYMSLGSAFGDQKEISKLQLDSMSAPQEALARMPGWLSNAAGKGANVTINRVMLKGAKLEVKNVPLPSFDADIALASDRSVRAATIETSDGHLTVEIAPRERDVEVILRGRSFQVPLAPGVELGDFSAKGVVSGSEIKVSELEYSIYGGHGTGSGTVSWGNAWNLEGQFELQRIDLEPAMKAFSADIPSSGRLEAKGRVAAQGTSLDKLLQAPRVESVFMVKKGDLSGLDLVRALQSTSRDGVAGGKTKFEELSGNLTVANQRYQYSGVKLQAGALNAVGQGEVSADADVTGKVFVELRSTASAVKGTYRITGTVKGMTLRP